MRDWAWAQAGLVVRPKANMRRSDWAVSVTCKDAVGLGSSASYRIPRGGPYACTPRMWS